jgi:hypothetical protein
MLVGRSLDDFVGSDKQRPRDRQAEYLRGLEVDDQLEQGAVGTMIVDEVFEVGERSIEPTPFSI